MNPGEGELHLGLHTRGPGDLVPRRRLGGVLEERCLADPRFATEDQDAAVALACLL
jgi:hypothetical protein